MCMQYFHSSFDEFILPSQFILHYGLYTKIAWEIETSFI